MTSAETTQVDPDGEVVRCCGEPVDVRKTESEVRNLRPVPRTAYLYKRFRRWQCVVTAAHRGMTAVFTDESLRGGA